MNGKYELIEILPFSDEEDGSQWIMGEMRAVWAEGKYTQSARFNVRVPFSHDGSVSAAVEALTAKADALATRIARST